MGIRQLFTDPVAFITQILLVLPGVVVALGLHEFAHGFVSYKLGDPTAKSQGRLSLNPLRHLDPIGMLMLVLVGFGWAKPVSVDARYYKNPKAGMALTALAGPVMNLIVAFVLLFAAALVNSAYGIAYMNGSIATGSGTETVLVIIWQLIYYGGIINIGLALFNLIPVPPLDGWKVVGALLPSKYYFGAMRFERYGTLILLALLLTDVLTRPLGAARDLIIGVYSAGIHTVLGLFGL